jgi:hypothetical protein
MIEIGISGAVEALDDMEKHTNIGTICGITDDNPEIEYEFDVNLGIVTKWTKNKFKRFEGHKIITKTCHLNKNVRMKGFTNG